MAFRKGQVEFGISLNNRNFSLFLRIDHNFFRALELKPIQFKNPSRMTIRPLSMFSHFNLGSLEAISQSVFKLFLIPFFLHTVKVILEAETKSASKAKTPRSAADELIHV